MKQLLNTLYVTSEDAYLSLKNDNVIVQQGDATLGRIPLRSLESVSIRNQPRRGKVAPLRGCVD